MASQRRVYDIQMQKRRDNEVKHDYLMKSVVQDKIMKENFRCEERTDDLRRRRRRHEQNDDFAMAHAIEQAEFERELLAKQRGDEQRIANEIQRRKNESLRDQKNYQRICEQSEDLRALESKLKLAYMNKERSDQIAERSLYQAKEKAYDDLLNHEMENERIKGLQKEEAKEAQRREMYIAQREVVMRQMDEREEQRRQQFEEFLEEKKKIDEIIMQIQQEEELEQMERSKQQQAAHEWMQKCIVERQEWIKEERARKMKEDADIAAYLEFQAKRDAELAEKKKQEEAAKQERYAQITKDMSNVQREKEYMEQLRM
eukprot:GFYU01008076.1.p1 GENE.GFYU01008076.1~~GFYU01008076.1.p1  ORF type:complete len:364 (-),score=126.97 GFYU01008076.1:7-954(-)